MNNKNLFFLGCIMAVFLLSMGVVSAVPNVMLITSSTYQYFGELEVCVYYDNESDKALITFHAVKSDIHIKGLKIYTSFALDGYPTYSDFIVKRGEHYNITVDMNGDTYITMEFEWRPLNIDGWMIAKTISSEETTSGAINVTTNIALVAELEYKKTYIRVFVSPQELVEKYKQDIEVLSRRLATAESMEKILFVVVILLAVSTVYYYNKYTRAVKRVSE